MLDYRQEGGRKAVDIPGSQQPLMLMRYKNKIIGSAAQCTRCKFPLVGADYSDSTLTWCVHLSWGFESPKSICGVGGRGVAAGGLEKDVRGG